MIRHPDDHAAIRPSRLNAIRLSASYTILIATAEALGDTETQLVCEQILREEENMGRWLEENLPT